MRKLLKTSHIVFITLVVVVAIVVIAMHDKLYNASTVDSTAMVLLLPDDASLDDPNVSLWIDAAAEEGLLLTPMRDSQFLRPWTDRSQFAGVVVPDQVHKIASEILIETLTEYVERGGQLMLVFDAGVWTREAVFAPYSSRLSHLVGIEYALYDSLQDRTTVREPVLGSESVYQALKFPPGKYIRYVDIPESLRQQPATGIVDKDFDFTISGYMEPVLQYDSFATAGDYKGKRLLQTPEGGVIAGTRRYGEGNVLFVNLPLGYLKKRTDGLLLHGFLRYFADDVLQVPYLAAVPNGVGGLTINWHLDSNAAFDPLQGLKPLGFYQQGPYSIHFTAGPDAHQFGDGEGLNVTNNKIIRQWIKTFAEKGYEIGSHGGWIHDYFASNLPDQADPEFERYLLENKNTLEEVLGRPVVEYSAPEGKHPKWVTGWLAEHDMIAYYTVGNAGMAPTRNYSDDGPDARQLWSFPILNYKWTAGFMEQFAYGFKDAEVSQWLRQVVDYCANNNTARMLYFHPRGPLNYPGAVREWLGHTDALQKQQRFRWYTMAEMARFLQKRGELKWGVTQQNNIQTFTASHPTSLAQLTWVLPQANYGKPAITEGQGEVKEAAGRWLLTAADVKQFQFNAQRIDDNE